MLRVAQIGIGYWGPNLLRNLVSNSRCQVVRVVDLSEERRAYVNKLYPSVEVTNDLQQVLEDKSIDAVIIATPVATHFDLAIRCLESDKHILVEKPMAKSAEEVDKIGRLASKKDKIAMVGHTFLFNDAVKYVKKIIDDGTVGELRYISSQRLNLGRIRSDVDALWNFAPHDVSIIQYWLNDITPESVVKRGVDYLQNNIDDVVFMNIIYPNKVMANIHVSWLDPVKVRRMTIVGTKKMVIYDDMAENKITIYDKGIDRKAILGENMDYDNQNFPIFNYRSGDIVIPKITFREPLNVEINHFFDCITSNIPCMTGTDHAREVVGILAS